MPSEFLGRTHTGTTHTLNPKIFLNRGGVRLCLGDVVLGVIFFPEMSLGPFLFLVFGKLDFEDAELRRENLPSIKSFFVSRQWVNGRGLKLFDMVTKCYSCREG